MSVGLQIPVMGASTSKHKRRLNHQRNIFPDRPSCPGKPMLVPCSEDVNSNIVTVEWTAPEFDGGSKILGYLVEHRRTGSPHWLRACPLRVKLTNLTLTNLEPGWRYQFRVFAENAVGLSACSPISEPFAISVHKSAGIAPYFTNELYSVKALENEKVEFSVSYQGIPNPKINWYVDGMEVYSDRCRRITTNVEYSTFVIYEVCLSDEGEIKCSATNRVGHAVTKAHLVVEALPAIRLPRQYEEGLLFESGENIRIKVSVVGKPRPSIYWYHNGDLITPNNRREITYEDDVTILRIKNSERLDRGEYQIQAISDIGEDSASILVTVANPPTAPENVRVVKTEGQTVTLSWDVPNDDGGCKIGCYVVEYYRVGWDVWLKAATSRKCSITLDDLIEGSQYNFRVKAENPYGISEASVETETVFIPDPNRGLFEPRSEEHLNNYDVKEVNYDENSSEILTFTTLYGSNHKLTSDTTQHDSKIYSSEEKLLHMENSEKENYKKDFVVENEGESDRSWTSQSDSADDFENQSDDNSELMLVLLPHSNNNQSKNTGSDSYIATPSNNLKITGNLSPAVTVPISFSAPELAAQDGSGLNTCLKNCFSSSELLHKCSMSRIYRSMHEKTGELDDLSDGKLNSRYNTNSETEIHLDNASQKRYEQNNNPEITVFYCDDTDDTNSDVMDSNDDISFIRDTEEMYINNNLKPKEVPWKYRNKENIPKTEIRSSHDSINDRNKNQNNRNKSTNERYEYHNDLYERNIKTFNEPIKQNIDTDSENESSSSSTSNLSEDSDSYEIGCSHKGHDDYNVNSIVPLSFETALAISHGGKITDTSNTILGNEEKDFIPKSNHIINNHVNKFNPNTRTVAEKSLKPILKSMKHSFSDSTDLTTLSKSKDDITKSDSSILKNKLCNNTTPQLSKKKQVRIEDPQSSINLQKRSTRSIVSNHYSDIVNEYSNVYKPPAKVYLTYDELKAAAEIEETRNKLQNQINYKEKDDTIKSLKTPDEVKFHQNISERELSPELQHHSSSGQMNKIDNKAVNTRKKMHFIFDCFLDAVMLGFAIWLYFFKDERLVIPILFLIIYRDIYSKIKIKISKMKNWSWRKNW